MPALLASSFSTYPIIIVTSVLLVEISQSLGVPVAVAAQMRTASSVAAIIGGLAVGALATRHQPRRILQAGLALLLASSLGGFLAPDLEALTLAVGLSGLGVAMVFPMTNTLVAEYYPLERRGYVLGYLGVAGGFGFLIGGALTSFIAGVGGWRLPFLAFAGTMSAMGLIACLRWLPSTPLRTEKVGLLTGFREIAGSASALFCLLAVVLANASIQGLYLYSFSYLQEWHGASVATTGLVYAATALFFMPGSYVTGGLVNRFGRKNVTILGVAGFSLFTLLMGAAPSLWTCVAFILVGHLFDSFRFSAFNALILEQSPGQRGTMTSVSSVATNLGYALGTGLGGLLLMAAGWRNVIFALGLVGFLAAAVLQVAVIDNKGI
ncbi:MAG: MFS transporter [Candidatus Bathyarchaeota archaeon]